MALYGPWIMYPGYPIFRYPMRIRQWFAVRTRVRTASTHRVQGGRGRVYPGPYLPGYLPGYLQGTLYGPICTLYGPVWPIWPCIGPYMAYMALYWPYMALYGP